MVELETAIDFLEEEVLDERAQVGINSARYTLSLMSALLEGLPPPEKPAIRLVRDYSPENWRIFEGRIRAYGKQFRRFQVRISSKWKILEASR
jgi:hypothetical protein